MGAWDVPWDQAFFVSFRSSSGWPGPSGDPADEVSLERKVWWVNKREGDQREQERGEVSLILTYKQVPINSTKVL